MGGLIAPRGTVQRQIDLWNEAVQQRIKNLVQELRVMLTQESYEWDLIKKERTERELTGEAKIDSYSVTLQLMSAKFTDLLGFCEIIDDQRRYNEDTKARVMSFIQLVQNTKKQRENLMSFRHIAIVQQIELMRQQQQTSEE